MNLISFFDILVKLALDMAKIVLFFLTVANFFMKHIYVCIAQIQKNIVKTFMLYYIIINFMGKSARLPVLIIR